MKKILFIVSLVMLLFACNKDKGNNKNKQQYLSKVFKNGILETEIFYTSDKKPIRRNFYATNTGTSVLSSFRIYEYNAENLLETMTEFSKNNNFINKYKIQYGANKKPARMDDLKNDNTTQFYHLFEYDAQGDLAKANIWNDNTNKQTVAITFSWSQHRLTKMIRRNYLNNPPTMLDSSTYSFSRDLPSHWNYFETQVFASLPNGDRTFMDMALDSSFYYYVDAPPSTSRATYSQKQYNSEGYLTKQHFSFIYTSFYNPPPENYDKTYEYIE
jgi:uncharacterized protein YcfL